MFPLCEVFSVAVLLSLCCQSQFRVCRGDQGFLNEYFKDFASGPMFDPTATYGPEDHRYMMLPTRYNADIGLYVLNSNHWSLEGPLKIVHYTLASFKPWSWWCGWLIEEQSRWNVSSGTHWLTLSLRNCCRICAAALLTYLLHIYLLRLC